MAAGGDKPAWPLPTVTPKFATWSFGGGRPAGCAVAACERWHAGVDLTGAPHDSLVIAPEDGILAGLDRGWTDGTKAIFLQTDSGLFVVLGGVIAGSHKEFGLITAQRVRKGDKLGRIVGGYGMLHLEAYKAEPTRKANSRWYRDDPPPEGLLNPTGYVERMVGDKVSLLQTRQRLEALRELGHYQGAVGRSSHRRAQTGTDRARRRRRRQVGPRDRGRDPKGARGQEPCAGRHRRRHSRR